MVLSNDLIQKFNEAKAGNFDAINYFVEYFMSNVEKQLQNLNFTPSEKSERINKCHELIIKNVCVSYDAYNFVNKTLEDIKNIIYLNQSIEINGSKDIILEQKEIIRSKIVPANLDLINVSVKDRELARLYYLENKTIDELANMFKCSKTIIYVRLRRTANAIMSQKVSTSVINDQSFLYRK